MMRLRSFWPHLEDSFEAPPEDLFEVPDDLDLLSTLRAVSQEGTAQYTLRYYRTKLEFGEKKPESTIGWYREITPQRIDIANPPKWVVCMMPTDDPNKWIARVCRVGAADWDKDALRFWREHVPKDFRDLDWSDRRVTLPATFEDPFKMVVPVLPSAPPEEPVSLEVPSLW